jgi:hypothetical protein
MCGYVAEVYVWVVESCETMGRLRAACKSRWAGDKIDEKSDESMGNLESSSHHHRFSPISSSFDQIRDENLSEISFRNQME